MSNEPNTINRAEFLRTCGAGCMGMVGLSLFLQGCSNVYYAQKPAIKDKSIMVSKSEFQEVKKGITTPRKFILVKLENQNFPIYVYRVSDTEYSAVLMKCTHQGNELTAHDGYLTCSSHGSEYDKTGKVTEGPAEKPLQSFKVTTDEQNVYINIG